MANLSGTWLGTYWQGDAPTRFEATLVQGGNSLSGRILDDGPLGEAQVSGEVVGRSVQFSKRYLTRSTAPIQYSGSVSADGNAMQGQWIIQGFDLGPWEAHRSDDELSRDWQNRLEQKTPIAVGVGQKN
ncbi:MAG: hypothetical protein HC886_08180 [Leptolyngbyaceae cyanobacterium SM1_1_3]|nr:hypothetical protein [Leptolyngbyaceae cyanobacterium SM1_1_3]NJM85520.1 hypothetical protein [Leptolyngbyaceae cyanobacterium RM2_2_21]NJN04165.1 hypothetical protein [Leptolyngbyaceae cyanobacterium RM1_1_2]NJO10517.1 hypothetical protein [Leptolyngbyaceae cyanobacterium SL_1_1]